MRLYPSAVGARARTIAGDAAVLAALVAFALLGLAVHDTVRRLDVLGRSAIDAGTRVREGTSGAAGAIREGFGRAGDAVDAAPVIGGPAADALRSAGDAAAGPLERSGTASEQGLRGAGQEAVDRVGRTATLLGWLVFGLPAALVLALRLPVRVAQVRRMTAAARVLDRAGAAPDAERRRAEAMRAAFGLPYATLLRHTDDPLGDLVAGRHEPLVAALREDAGLAPPPTAPSPSPGSRA